VDAHEPLRNLAFELVENRLAETDRHSRSDQVDSRADRVAGSAQLVEEHLELRHLVRIGRKERILVDVVEIERPQLERADLGEIAANLYGKLLSEILARDRAGRDAHDGLTRGRAATAAVVTNAVLLLIRVVGVAGAEAVLDLRVVAAFLIDVLDEQADRRSRRATLEDAGEDLHLIRLLPLRNMARAAGPASIEIFLD